MYRIYALLFLTLNCSLPASEVFPCFRETIAKYGHTDKDTDHSYVESYESLLASFQNKACNVMEIGVNFGGSAIMWHEYLSESKLFLLDNRNVMIPRIKEAMNPDRWHLYLGDAYSIEMVEKMKEECPEGFDIIIDDGPHSLQSQIFAITDYLPLLKEGGLLVIEDIQHFRDVEVLRHYAPNGNEFEIEVIDLRLLSWICRLAFLVKRPTSANSSKDDSRRP